MIRNECKFTIKGIETKKSLSIPRRQRIVKRNKETFSIERSRENSPSKKYEKETSKTPIKEKPKSESPIKGIIKKTPKKEIIKSEDDERIIKFTDQEK